ncbi:recombination-associated protein RdgC [Xanthomonas perforans]|uniref:recombination-associated protein RdgC n=3 Tax=Xanthomonas perforans TaxID=442694 RepID=UPI00062CFA9B|nr:recombination-associated protein RdgC [Xanthomonas perforans]KLC64086.1 recombinase RdgC [Xanthomonas perforans]KLC65967.1 recombinase RdgC [Xanthomonas perforans]KLC72452.1 recombinase RdgC [Xanthomonas perforans]KLC72506.1 recombinase RdgC [Xanthomonas perforans]KLC80179.1 recombinase RdgC [Xanthomonas perforans]
MFFRNLTMFRFPISLDLSAVEELLPRCALKPVGALEMASRGFVSPFGREETDQLSHRIGDFLWLAVGGQDKMLPGAVINDALEQKCAEIEKADGRRPGAKARKRLKDDIIHDLLPKAFVRNSRTDVILDLAHGLAIVDTSSRKVGESVVSEIRGMLGSFPALTLNAEVAPRAVLTGWIAGEPLPESLSIGEEAELRDPIEGGAIVKCQHQELRGDEIEKHLEAGKQVTKLALVLDDNLSFVLGDDLVIRKLKFLDGALDQLDDVEGDGARAELDARFALQSAEMRRLFLVLEQALRLSKVEG